MTYKNSVTNIGVTVGAESVTRAVGKVAGSTKGSAAGLIVQPVVWVATGTAPDAGDGFLYGVGVVAALAGSALLAGAGAVTGIIKAAVDDHTQSLVDEAKLDEPAYARDGIFPLGDYSFWASDNEIQAMTIASYGGVVWKHKNGALCFIRDAKGHLVCDYEPKSWVKQYRPQLPLKAGSKGRVKWDYRTK